MFLKFPYHYIYQLQKETNIDFNNIGERNQLIYNGINIAIDDINYIVKHLVAEKLYSVINADTDTGISQKKYKQELKDNFTANNNIVENNNLTIFFMGRLNSEIDDILQDEITESIENIIITNDIEIDNSVGDFIGVIEDASNLSDDLIYDYAIYFKTEKENNNITKIKNTTIDSMGYLFYIV